MLPVPESGEIPQELLGLVRTYDPDWIAADIPTLAYLAEADPEVIDRVVARYAEEGESPQDAWSRLSAEEVEDRDWGGLAAELDAWCSPFKGVRPDARAYSAPRVGRFRHRGEVGGFSLLPSSISDTIFALDLTEVDPTLALMLETRVGRLDSTEQGRSGVVELPVEDEDLAHLVRVAITGEASAGWDLHTRYLTAHGTAITAQPPAALTVEDYLANTPFARTQRWLARVTTATEPPVVCVIGDSANDHALALLCDRLFQHAAWVPLTLLNRNNELGLASKAAVYALKFLSGAPDRPVLVTSASQGPDVVGAFAAEFDAMYTVLIDAAPVASGPSFLPITPEQLSHEQGRCFLADPKSYAVRRDVPLRESAGDVSLPIPVEVPLPEAAERLGPELRWYIDIELPRHVVPARTALPSGALQNPPGSMPDAAVRSSRPGLTFLSANVGFVPAGASLEGRLAHPLLRYPAADQIFGELAAKHDATVERSDAGRRAANATELWGSFDAISADLIGTTRKLLDAFLPPTRKKKGDYQAGYAIRSHGYLTFGHAAKALDTDSEGTRETLDRLSAINVLRRGFILNCERCHWEAFYTIELVTKSFECTACSHVNILAQGRWYKGDTEPAWNYGLDQVVRDLLKQHGDLPLLAAAHLRRDASSFLWAPELSIDDGVDPVELDVCLIVDGRVIVGEAKSNGRLDSGKGAMHAATRLVRAAQLLGADSVVLATSEPEWVSGARTAVDAALSTYWTRGPRPKIIQMTNL